MLRDGMVPVVNSESGRQRWPVVSVEDTSADKFDEPGPMGVAVVVSGDVKTEPATAVGHVLLEGRALLLRIWKVVKPEYELIVGEIFGIEVVPVGSGCKLEMIALGGGGIELQRVMRKVDVIALNVFGVESQNAEGRLLLRGRSEREECECNQCTEDASHLPAAHRMEL